MRITFLYHIKFLKYENVLSFQLSDELFCRTEKGLTVNSLISYIQLIQNMLECKGHLQKMSKPISDQNVFRSFQL